MNNDNKVLTQIKNMGRDDLQNVLNWYGIEIDDMNEKIEKSDEICERAVEEQLSLEKKETNKSPAIAKAESDTFKTTTSPQAHNNPR